MGLTRTYDLSNRGTALSSIEIRELTAADYFAALERAEGPQGGRVTGAQVKAECVSDAIVAVDGEPVAQPFGTWTSWGMRTGTFVGAAYADLNELSAADLVKLDAMPGPVYDLATAKIDVGLRVVTFRELTTKEELAALAAGETARAKLGRGANTAHAMAAAVEVDGVKLTPEAFLALPVRASQVLELLYQRVNSARADELEDFVKAARSTDAARGERT